MLAVVVTVDVFDRSSGWPPGVCFCGVYLRLATNNLKQISV